MDSQYLSSEDEQEVDNTLLVQALNACRDAYSRQNREHAYRELLRSTLLIPSRTRPSEAPADGTEESGREEVGLMMAENPETREPVILAFTDRETMSKYQVPENCCLALPASKLLARLTPDAAPSLIVCAPDAFLPISHSEILVLATGQIPPPQVTGTPSDGHRPAHISFKPLDTALPSSVRQELDDLLGPVAEINDVFIFLMREDEQEPGVTAVVIFSNMPSEGAPRPLLDELAACITPYLPGKAPLAVIALEEDDDFAIHLGKVMLPYYTRGKCVD